MKNLIIIGHPYKKSFCYNGIFKTIFNEINKSEQELEVIDLYRDSFSRPRTKLIEKYKGEYSIDDLETNSLIDFPENNSSKDNTSVSTNSSISIYEPSLVNSELKSEKSDNSIFDSVHNQIEEFNKDLILQKKKLSLFI